MTTSFKFIPQGPCWCGKVPTSRRRSLYSSYERCHFPEVEIRNSNRGYDILSFGNTGQDDIEGPPTPNQLLDTFELALLTGRFNYGLLRQVWRAIISVEEGDIRKRGLWLLTHANEKKGPFSDKERLEITLVLGDLSILLKGIDLERLFLVLQDFRFNYNIPDREQYEKVLRYLDICHRNLSHHHSSSTGSGMFFKYHPNRAAMDYSHRCRHRHDTLAQAEALLTRKILR